MGQSQLLSRILHHICRVPFEITCIVPFRATVNLPYHQDHSKKNSLKAYCVPDIVLALWADKAQCGEFLKCDLFQSLWPKQDIRGVEVLPRGRGPGENRGNVWDLSLGNWLVTEMDFFFKEEFLKKWDLSLRLLLVILRKAKSHNF